MIETTIKRGSYVRILGSAKGTAWETGYVMDINEEGALINYGSGQMPIYGMAIRKSLDKLEVIEMKIPFDDPKELSEEDRIAAVGAAMVIHGGEFMKAIGRALLHSNATETRKLKEAFPREWNEYAALAGIEA